MTDELLETWNTNTRINSFLLSHISDDGMKCSLSKHGGRDVAAQFAHMHNVRTWQLEKRAKDLSVKLKVFETKVSPSKKQLEKALSASNKVIGVFLSDVLTGLPKRKGFKRGIFTTLSYFIAHEAHHRGSILLTLKGCGHKLDSNKTYGIWGWDQI
jgi:uncharacterized damage-inducible protein DinB